MNNMEIRILKVKDADAVDALVNSRDNMMGNANPIMMERLRTQSSMNTRNLLYHSDLGHSMCLLFGAFDAGQLVGVLYTVCSSEQPCYYLTRAHTLKGVANGAAILGSLLGGALDVYEKAGFRRFYTMYPSDLLRAYQPLWRSPRVLQDYLTYTDLEVGPFERPKFNEYWEILFSRVLFPNPILVRGFVKKTNTDLIQRG
jgi:hypothetical protein